MVAVARLVALFERGAQRFAAEAARARTAGPQACPERFKGEADAFLLMAQELREHGDPAALLESLYEMEQAAAWTACLDEEKAAQFEAEGNLSASRYHARSARYSQGLIEGYNQARMLLAAPPTEGESPADA